MRIKGVEKRGKWSNVLIMKYSLVILAAIFFQVKSFAVINGTAVSVELVKVGNPNNTPNLTNGYGSVSYEYFISKYEVTIGEWCAFLNSVAKTSSAPFYSELYNTNMSSDYNSAGILRIGESGQFQYAVIGSPRRPITYVTWISAAMFCNWLQNGQGTNSYLYGSYDLRNGTSGNSIIKNQNANFRLPNKNEWFKAAYFNPNTQSYTEYATRSDSAPLNENYHGTNQANVLLNGKYFLTQNNLKLSNQNYLTEVGSFVNSSSYYGTFDQNGNVTEWLEDSPNEFLPDSRLFWGGRWDGENTSRTGSSLYLKDSDGQPHNGYGIYGASSKLGFRIVASQESGNQVMSLIIESSNDLKTWNEKQLIPVIITNGAEFFRLKIKE